MTRLPGIAGRVEVHDYTELLAPDAAEFSALYERLRMERDLDALVDPDTWGRLFRSFRAAMNTRGLGLTYAQMRAVFGPAPNPKDPLVQRVDSMARDGLKTQLAIKLAADAMGFLDRWRPDHLRVSCHKGLKHGRAVLGLRSYPEYYRSSRLLPYHGVALVTEHKGRKRMVIQPEMVLRGRTDLTRVTDEHGATWCYLG